MSAYEKARNAVGTPKGDPSHIADVKGVVDHMRELCEQHVGTGVMTKDDAKPIYAHLDLADKAVATAAQHHVSGKYYAASQTLNQAADYATVASRKFDVGDSSYNHEVVPAADANVLAVQMGTAKEFARGYEESINKEL
jgi:hypothetical protein